MKSLIDLTCSLLEESGSMLGVDVSRDLVKTAWRVEHEGEGFLTLTLPTYAKALERSLARGELVPDFPTTFGRMKGFPEYLRDILALVFDRQSGRLLDEPKTVLAIACLRQITMAHGKVVADASPKRMHLAFNGFVGTDKEISSLNFDDEEIRHLRRIGAVVFGDAFMAMDRKVQSCSLKPKHGPGSVVERLRGNAKYRHTTWSARLDAMFPLYDYVIPSGHYVPEIDAFSLLPARDESPVRVMAVPKTQKTPRIIAIEPTSMQYAQQALLREFGNQYRKDPVLRWLVCSDSQEPNRSMARRGSITGDLATIDLSEASDRVSNQLVCEIFRPWSNLLEALQACRSTTADVPGWGVIRLAKFASMGSGVTFPVESAVFAICVLRGWEVATGRRITRGSIMELRGSVRVYGDDIIVPTAQALSVAGYLGLCGLKVNCDKSFWTGSFRESCGGDYYQGVDVTPVRVRRQLPQSRRDEQEIISAVSLMNQLQCRGFSETSERIARTLRKLIPLPIIESETSPILGQVLVGERPSIGRMNPFTHEPEVRGLSVVPVHGTESPLTGWRALMKWFLERGSMPLSKDCYIISGRPVAVKLKHRWALPH